MSDYHAGWPLWDDYGQMSPTDLPLPDALASRITAWQDFFEQNFHHERGWRTPEHAIAYAKEGRTLHRWLNRYADVDLDLWPV